GTRHSTLSRIDQTNVGGLALSWVHQFPQEPLIEATPLVRDGVMYISIPPCSVHALNAETGKTIWTWRCELLNAGGGELGGLINRGVAMLDNRIFVATWDA